MKNVILTCVAMFLMVVSYAQTQQAPKPSTMPQPPSQNNPAMQAPMPGQDPMSMSPASEKAQEQAEEADSKGPNGEPLSPEQRTDKWIANLNKTVTLTNEQQARLRPIITNTFMQKDQMKKQGGDDINRMQPMIHQINMQRNQIVRQTLSPEQWNKLVQMRNEAGMKTTPHTTTK